MKFRQPPKFHVEGSVLVWSRRRYNGRREIIHTQISGSLTRQTAVRYRVIVPASGDFHIRTEIFALVKAQRTVNIVIITYKDWGRIVAQRIEGFFRDDIAISPKLTTYFTNRWVIYSQTSVQDTVGVTFYNPID